MKLYKSFYGLLFISPILFANVTPQAYETWLQSFLYAQVSNRYALALENFIKIEGAYYYALTQEKQNFDVVTALLQKAQPSMDIKMNMNFINLLKNLLNSIQRQPIVVGMPRAQPTPPTTALPKGQQRINLYDHYVAEVNLLMGSAPQKPNQAPTVSRFYTALAKKSFEAAAILETAQQALEEAQRIHKSIAGEYSKNAIRARTDYDISDTWVTEQAKVLTALDKVINGALSALAENPTSIPPRRGPASPTREDLAAIQAALAENGGPTRGPTEPTAQDRAAIARAQAGTPEKVTKKDMDEFITAYEALKNALVAKDRDTAELQFTIIDSWYAKFKGNDFKHISSEITGTPRINDALIESLRAQVLGPK